MNKSYLKRKEKILITAIDIVDQVGAQGMTTKEIAKRNNISEPAIYKQFKSKQEIVTGVLEKYAAFDELIRNTVLQAHISGCEGLELFYRAYADYYQNYPQIASILFTFDLYRYDLDTAKFMQDLIARRKDTLLVLVERAISNGELLPDTDAATMAEILFATLIGTIFHWKLGEVNFTLTQQLIEELRMLVGNKVIAKGGAACQTIQ